MSFPRLFQRTALVLFGCLVALGLAEVLVRLFQLAPADGVVTVTTEDFGRIPGIYAPEQNLVERSDRHLPYHVVIDSLGFRGAELQRAKAAGTRRLLMLGDSFMFGEFVPEGETLPEQLEREIRRGCPDVQVINAGLPGSTIVDQREMLRRGLSLAPDGVVLAMSSNDLEDLTVASMWDRLAENRAAKSHFPLSIAYPVLRHLALFNLLQQVRAAAFNRQKPRGALDTLRLLPARERYGRELVAVRDTLRALGVPLLFVLYPDHHLIGTPDYHPVLRWGAALGVGDSIPTLDVTPALRASHQSLEQLYLLPWDGHPSATGYGIAAREIAPRIGGPFANCAPRRSASAVTR